MQNFAVKNICKKFSFVKAEEIGKSLCKRSIWALSVGNRKNMTLYAGTFHGMEWINTLILLSFFEELCNHYKNRSALLGCDVFSILSNQGLMVIPCVNPDGVEIQIKGASACPQFERLINKVADNTKHWQSNARGVDLNHNFNAGWKQLRYLEISQGIKGPAPTRYGGKYPFSEPETIALKNLCIRKKFSHVIAFHSQGREVYSAYRNTPQKSIDLGNKFARLAEYKVSEPEEIATGGGFKDWVIGYLKTPAITVETGLGKNPLPIGDFQPEYNRIKNALVECIII
ncbi:MAG: M14 family metallocarboxypeptidase [Ruminococcus sp.]